MGSSATKPAPPSTRDVTIDVSSEKGKEAYNIPDDVAAELRGSRNTIKIYDTKNRVNQWIRDLNDIDTAEGSAHPFLTALGEVGLCHGSYLTSSFARCAIASEVCDSRHHVATFFAFNDAGHIVGFSVVSVDTEKPDELYREVTCTGVRRAGWGRKLDTAVLEYAKKLGKARVRLSAASPDALAAHTAMGFSFVGKDEDDNDVMVKELSGGRRKTRRRRSTRKKLRR